MVAICGFHPQGRGSIPRGGVRVLTAIILICLKRTRHVCLRGFESHRVYQGRVSKWSKEGYITKKELSKFQQLLWPSGLRRGFQVPISSEAQVRILLAASR